jgi:hypothetical protein
MVERISCTLQMVNQKVLRRYPQQTVCSFAPILVDPIPDE